MLAEEDVIVLCAKHLDTGLRLARRVGLRVLAEAETEATLSVLQTTVMTLPPKLVTVCDDEGSGKGSICTGSNDIIFVWPNVKVSGAAQLYRAAPVWTDRLALGASAL